MSKKYSPEEIKELIENDELVEEFESIPKDEMDPENIRQTFNVTREMRLDELFDKLNINEEDFKKARKKKIPLSPTSVDWPLFSELYRDHDGEYVVEDLIYEYHDEILRQGIITGMEYGKKFAVEDIQNKRFSKKDIMNMSEKDLLKYINEKKENI